VGVRRDYSETPVLLWLGTGVFSFEQRLDVGKPYNFEYPTFVVNSMSRTEGQINPAGTVLAHLKFHNR
jgi:hypothetical protein